MRGAAIAPNTSFRARLFAPTEGIPEDPATGSATAVLAAQLLAAERLGDGTHAFALEQGYEMGRPSDLHLEADIQGGKLTAVEGGGERRRGHAGDARDMKPLVLMAHLILIAMGTGMSFSNLVNMR